MSMADVYEALRLITTHADRGFFAGPRDPGLVTSAERALGGQLPPTYHAFVKNLGAGNFGAFEIYGLIDAEFEESSIPNGVWLTLNERRESGLPNELIIVGSTGDGDYYCIEQNGGEESPVFVYKTGVPPEWQRGEEVAQDFGQFMLDGIRGEI